MATKTPKKKLKSVATELKKPAPPSLRITSGPEAGFLNCTDEGLGFVILGAPRPRK